MGESGATLRPLFVSALRHVVVAHHRIHSVGEERGIDTQNHVVAGVGAVAIDVLVAVVPENQDLGLRLGMEGYAHVDLVLPVFDLQHRAFSAIALIAPLPIRSLHHAVPFVQFRIQN